MVETCKAIADKYVYIPKGDLLKEIGGGFGTRRGFPQAIGAIDGSHVPIIWPQESASD